MMLMLYVSYSDTLQVSDTEHGNGKLLPLSIFEHEHGPAIIRAESNGVNSFATSSVWASYHVRIMADQQSWPTRAARIAKTMVVGCGSHNDNVPPATAAAAHDPDVTDDISTLSVSSLCDGIGAFSHALLALSGVQNFRFQRRNTYEIDARLQRIQNHLDNIAWDSSPAKCGQHDGDILSVCGDEIKATDALVASPPCPPLSQLGKREVHEDKRIKVFTKVLQIIIAMSSRNLSFFVIENVEGMAWAKKAAKSESTSSTGDGTTSSTPYLETVLQTLRNGLPRWSLGVWEAQTRSFLPHSRTRIFVYGMRPELAELCSYGYGKLSLRSLMIPDNPPCIVKFLQRRSLFECQREFDRLTSKMAANVLEYSSKIASLELDNRTSANDGDEAMPVVTYWVADISRKLESAWNCKLTRDSLPCLTTQNHYLWIFRSPPDLGCCYVPVPRQVTIQERAAVCGFHDSDLMGLPTWLKVHTLGNTIPVPC